MIPRFWGRSVVLLLMPSVCLLPLLFAGQRSAPPVRSFTSLSAFHDWTTNRAVYGHTGTLEVLEAARKDPRARFRWREIEEREFRERQARWLEIQPWRLRDLLQFSRPPSLGRFPVRAAADLRADWSISLGTGSVAAGQYPAKFTFDTSAPVSVLAGSCTSDFIVYPVNVNGSATQPNIVAFDNLYSGTAGGNGICNRAAPVNDDGVSATVLWSYNVHAIAAGGAVPTSPVLSLDGTKVAFVESAAGNAAHFHVLAWKSGDGLATNKQTVTSPASITTFAANTPLSAGTATDLALGSAATGTDSLSSPYIDYAHDTAYIGNDVGVLFRVKNVFCTTPACGTAVPSLDTAWGGTGSVNVPCSAELTGPVQDFYTLNIFVGCSDGKVYGFNSSGVPLATPSITVGDGSATGGVVESPIVDGLNRLIYVVSGKGAAPNSGNAVIVQATTSLGGPCAGALCIATAGVSGVFPLHSPAFNDPYFTSNSSTTWLLYQMAYSSAANLTLYAVNFGASRTLTAGAAAKSLNFGTHMGEYAPITEFDNAGTDRLFFSIAHAPAASVLNLGACPINTFPTGAPPGVSEGAGTSGMVVDNSSASNQASSIYFANLGTTAQGGNVAVKLTQANLN
jgi:hypothetical protein